VEKNLGRSNPSESAGLPDYVLFSAESGSDAELDDFITRSGVNRPVETRYENVSALTAFTKQMSVYPTLTAEAQRERLNAYQAGMSAAATLAGKKKIRSREERRLTEIAEEGERAQIELLGSMFRLVILIARELATRRYGRENALTMLEDLVAEANLELIEALHRVNTDNVERFSAYAGKVARARIAASLNKDAHIQVPSAWLRVNSIASTRIPELFHELGRKPTSSEVQEALLERCYQWAYEHLTSEQLKLPADERTALMRAKLVKQGMLGAIERYEEVVTLTRAALSIDAPVGEDGSSSLGDLAAMPNTGADSVYDEVERGAMAAAVAEVLSTLNERERDIILRRFGWFDGQTWTYARLAPIYGVSAERVRQIEAGVLERLRGPDFSQLSDFMPGA
jgi:RNA polymerase sigma factor (sigma-70 family)